MSFKSRQVLACGNLAVVTATSTAVPTNANAGRRAIRIKNFDASAVLYVAFDEAADTTKYPIKAGEFEEFPALASTTVNVYQGSGGNTQVAWLELD